MKVTVEKNVLVIRFPLNGKTLSKSGKSHNIATTHGNVRTEAEYEGQRITVGLNAYIPNTAR